MTPGNKYTYATFIAIDCSYNEWRGARNIFSSHEGTSQKIIEKHFCIRKIMSSSRQRSLNTLYLVKERFLISFLNQE